MAVPVYTGNGGLATGTGFNVIPSFPSTVNLNDIAIMLVMDADGDTFGNPTGVTGWTRITADGTNSNMSYDVWWLRCDGTEDSAPVTCTSVSNAGQLVTGVISTFSGCVTTGIPYEILSESGIVRATENPFAVGSTTYIDRLACGFCVIEDDVSYTADTGEVFAEAYHLTTDVGSDGGMSLQTKDMVTAGAVSSDDILTCTVGGTDYHVEIFFALKAVNKRRIFKIT